MYSFSASVGDVFTVSMGDAGSSIDPELDLLGKLVGNLTPEETSLLNNVLDKIRMNEETSGANTLLAEASSADTFAHSR